MDARASAEDAGLLEREPECDRLDRALVAAADGEGSMIAVEGEAGIGKSSLLSYLSDRADRAGMRVLTARGGELERDFAFGVVRQLFEAALASAPSGDRERWLSDAAGLARSVVNPAAIADGADRELGAILHGLYWLTANLATEQPLLIAIDDAHWADPVSIAFLTYLARRVDELAALLVYASRPAEGAGDALPAVAEPEIAQAVLRPTVLSERATAELVSRRLAHPGTDRFMRACHVATGGNPFLLKELLTTIQAEHVTPEDAGAASIEHIAPKSIARATLPRLRRLGAAAHGLAFSVAVLGTNAELRRAAELAHLANDVAAHAADALADASILRAGRPLEFVHPIVRTTIYDELGPGLRAIQHKRAARILDSDGVGDIALAPHLLASEPSGDPWIVDRLLAAAHEATKRGALGAACTYLERAQREPPSPCERPSVLLALGSAELQLGRPGAIAHLRTALDDAVDTRTRFRAAHELAVALQLDNRAGAAIEMGAEVLARLPGDDEESLRFRGHLAAIAQFAPTVARASLDGLSVYQDTLRGDTTGERLILACLAFRRAHDGPASSTVELARRALGDGALLDEYRPGSSNFFLAVWALVHAGHLEQAERLFDHAIEAARRRGSMTGVSVASACRCQVLIRQGHLAQAETEALSTLSMTGPHAVARPMLLSCLMDTMAERSDRRDVQSFLAEHDLGGDLQERTMGGMLLFSRGHLRLATGDARAALADFEALRRRDELSGLDTPAIPTRASQALACAQVGHNTAALALADDEISRAQDWGTASALAFALRTAGLVAGAPEGIELLRRAVGVAEQSDARYELARCLTEFGAALRRAGQRSDARVPLRRALELADRCGALRLAARARDELVATGARPRRAALHGRDSLTPSERRVAQLAADGLGNKQIAQSLFVTVRTVESHMTNVYAKLNLQSREGLADALRDAV